MDRIRKYIRMAVEVEIFACAHITAMLFLYGFLQWLMYRGSVSFPILLEQMVLGYVMSWVQKALFLKEKPYTKREYRVREFLWCMLPGSLAVAAGRLGRWFPKTEWQVSIGFYGILFAYFILLWLFLKHVYQEETKEINQLLKQRREERKEQ